jgi:hypothetical protein
MLKSKIPYLLKFIVCLLLGGLFYSVAIKTINESKPSTYVVGDNDYNLIDKMDTENAENVCNYLNKGDVYSLTNMGGYLYSAVAISKCLYHRDVTLAIHQAGSAAVLLVFAAPKICLYPDAKVIFHRPSITVNSSEDFNRRLMQKMDELYTENLAYMGNSEETIKQYLLYTHKAADPSNTTGWYEMPHEILIELLGDKFIGYCV